MASRCETVRQDARSRSASESGAATFPRSDGDKPPPAAARPRSSSSGSCQGHDGHFLSLSPSSAAYYVYYDYYNSAADAGACRPSSENQPLTSIFQWLRSIQDNSGQPLTSLIRNIGPLSGRRLMLSTVPRRLTRLLHHSTQLRLIMAICASIYVRPSRINSWPLIGLCFIQSA